MDALTKLHEIFRVLIGESAEEWVSQRNLTDFTSEWEWASHLLTVHKQCCYSNCCKLNDSYIPPQPQQQTRIELHNYSTEQKLPKNQQSIVAPIQSKVLSYRVKKEPQDICKDAVTPDYTKQRTQPSQNRATMRYNNMCRGNLLRKRKLGGNSMFMKLPSKLIHDKPESVWTSSSSKVDESLIMNPVACQSDDVIIMSSDEEENVDVGSIGANDGGVPENSLFSSQHGQDDQLLSPQYSWCVRGADHRQDYNMCPMTQGEMSRDNDQIYGNHSDESTLCSRVNVETQNSFKQEQTEDIDAEINDSNKVSSDELSGANGSRFWNDEAISEYDTYQTAVNHYSQNSERSQILGGTDYSSLIIQTASSQMYQCHICYRTFLRKDYLTKHFSVHTDMRVYDCSYCNKSFKYKTSLNRHRSFHCQHNQQL